MTGEEKRKKGHNREDNQKRKDTTENMIAEITERRSKGARRGKREEISRE